MVDFISPVLGSKLGRYLIGVILLLVVGFASGFGMAWKLRGHTVSKLKGQVAQVRTEHATQVKLATERIKVLEATANSLRDKAQAHGVEVVTKVRTKIKEVTKNVPVYIPVAVDTQYPLPDGFVCVLDEAITGQPATSPGPCDTPGAASTVKASEAANTLVYNIGVGQDCCERLKLWQEFYSQLREHWNKNQVVPK